MKRLFVLVIFLVVVALAFPLINLVVGAPENRLHQLEIEDAQLAAVAQIFANKCVNCHTEDHTLPWYANFPIARGLIEEDIRLGLRTVDILEFFPPEDGEPVNEAFLAKVEHTTTQGTMPPLHYLALHWNHRLSADETQTILDWVRDVRAEHFRVDGVAEAFANEAAQPLPRDIEVDADQVALGEKLFFDERLSADNTITCASCHAFDKGGTDQARVSTGIDDQLGPINSPTVFNALFNLAQFWDGRAEDLVDQAGGPVTDPLEMGSTWPQVLEKLRADEAFMDEFLASYPEITPLNIQHAIAEFERTLTTPNSDFDRYLRGETDAMSEAAQRGYALFKDYGCVTCHVGRSLGGQSFELMGYRKDYFSTLDRELTDQDMGRYNVTGEERDRHKFKVPTLLNIELTFPYFHDGSVDDLTEAIDIMARFQLDVELSQQELDDLTEFMKALTGEYQGEKLE